MLVDVKATRPSYSSAHWWRNVITCTLSFVRYCWRPALLLTLGTLSVHFGGAAAQATLQHDGNSITLGAICMGFLACLAALIASLVLMIWGFAGWLIRLTAFSRALLSFPREELTGCQLQFSAVVEMQANALRETELRKQFLGQFWLLIGLYMMPPLIVVCVLLTIKLAAIASLERILPAAPLLVLPSWADVTIVVFLIVLVVYITELSFIALALSSKTSLSPQKAAMRSASLSFRFIIPGAIMSCALIVLNAIIATPQVLFVDWHQTSKLVTNFSSVTNLPLQTVSDIWQGLTSVVLWTFMVAPACELIRGHTD